MLSNGVFVGVNDVVGLAPARSSEELVDHITEDVAIVPTSLGWLGVKLDNFDATLCRGSFMDRTTQCRNLVPASDHLARNFERVALHTADGPEGAGDVEESQRGMTGVRI
jgi:hypothetical protein